MLKNALVGTCILAGLSACGITSARAQNLTKEQTVVAGCAAAATEATPVATGACVAVGLTLNEVDTCLSHPDQCFGSNNTLRKAINDLFGGGNRNQRNDHPIWRLYNPSTEEHFYTYSCDEARQVVGSGGFRWEGFAFGLTPLHWPESTEFDRYFDGSKHFYQVPPNPAPAVLKFEGPLGGVFHNTDHAFGPLYRAFNPTSGDHLYTTSRSDFNNAITRDGYKDEGVAGYVRPDLPGITPCM